MTKLFHNRNFAPARHLTRDEFITPFDRMFDDIVRSMFPSISKDLGGDFFVQGAYPKVNVLNGENDITIEAAIPGMEKSDVQVEITDGVLTIFGASNQDKEFDGTYVRREIKKSSFKRSFRLGDNLNQELITGSYDKGILTLTIPKIVPESEEVKTKTVQIS